MTLSPQMRWRRHPSQRIFFLINDLLTLSQEVKDTIIEILKNDDVSTIVTSPTKECDSCCMSISFSDEDLLLGSKLHNRPLYVSGYVWEQKLNQILIDNGSAVNILSKSTMNQLDTVRLKIVIGDLQASTIFHGIEKIDADTKPFTKAESHFADAKFYTKSEDVSEVISTEVPMTKGTFKHEQEMITTKKSNKGDAPNGQKNDEPMTPTKSRAPETEDDAFPSKEVSNSLVLQGEYIDSGRQKSSFNLRVHSTFCLSKAKHNCKEGTICKPNSNHKKICLQKVKRVDNESEDEVDVAGCCHVIIEETFDHDIFEEDVEAAPLSLEDGCQSTIDELKEVNLGTKEEPRPTFIRNARTRSKGGRSSLNDQTRASANATYQCAMQRIFDDVLHKHVECYVDNLIVKSKKKCDHLKDLKLVLDHFRKYELRMNPLKCAFDVTSGKFLGFIVRHRGIKVDHSKIDAIQKMPSPKNLHELRRLQGRLAYIRRFISNLAGRCQPFQKLMRKDAVFDWDQSCQNAFDSIKKYLLNPPVLNAPAAGKPIISSVILKRLAKWAIILLQYDIVYISQKAVKGQALADFLADHPVPSNCKLCDDLPDEEVLFVESMEPWIMFFDGATRRSGAGVGIVFISPEKHMLSYSFTLGELCSNNVVEYQALIIGLQMTSELGIKYIEIFGDSKLIINQLSYQYKPPEPLHPTIASWPFEAWGLDLVGPIMPKSSAGHSYILTGTDYFSKWVEAMPLREAKKDNIVNFVRTHIIYRYGIPHRIVTDNGRQFSNTFMDDLCEKFNFKQYKSSMYNAATNGLAEAFNKTLCSLLKKVVSKTKRDWQEKIGEVLWAYRTTHCTSIGLTIEDNAKLRLQELEALDEKRLEAQQALECCQARMSKAFDKHVRPRSFQVGDLVLAVRRPIIMIRHTENKFIPKWDRPYIVKEVFTNEAYKIIDQDGL
ncbi:uncharacterized protein E6C27_scaffold74G002660 [Cucumis melo var. makuwa]|uniref:Integrase catalytic domain-containing protein n=1 Tax=Cucumis melo var. makuwa TaxID=1194695 RepID=A0A5A7TP37_CUCMM|nr:uncharacterized protein E6C27_scaffold74G002660 [Cucumis melo var. makuwa]